MSITRLFTSFNQKKVLHLGDVGGPRSDQVDAEIDNIIAGINAINIKTNGFIVGYPRCIRNARPAAPNVGGGLDTLESFDLPIGNLLTNGDFTDILYTVSINNNDNDKRVVLTIGGTIVLNMAAVVDLDALAAIVFARVSRVNDTTIDVSVLTKIGNVHVNSTPALTASVGYFAEAEYAQVTVSDLDTNVLNFLLQAEGTANNDLVLFTVQQHVTQMT